MSPFSPVFGMFCWPELATTDTTAAKAFYGALLGWIFAPGGEGMEYHLAKWVDAHVGAIGPLQADLQAQGVPPHWLSFVSVENADLVAAKAVDLGGHVLAGPFDVFEMGRMAVLQDNQGAVFALWQPMTFAGIERYEAPGALGWTELRVSDVDKAKAFYTSLLGWQAEDTASHGFPYAFFRTGKKAVAGLLKIEPGVDYPQWLPYFQIASAKESFEKATVLGAELWAEPFEMKGVGPVALLKDPQGAAFGLFESKK